MSTAQLDAPAARPASTQAPRIAVLFSELSGYMRACLAALRARHGAEVFVIHYPVASEAPFAEDADGWADAACPKGERTAAELFSLVEDFDPDGILMSGWIDRDYLQVARAFRRRGVKVVAGSDAPWRGTWRQRAATLAATRMLHASIDILWVAGERQRTFARRLGFRGNRCLSGYYACDWARFAGAYGHRDAAEPAFLFVGRYHPVKGVDELVDAYRRYRTLSPDPWPLVCAGTGPLQTRLSGVPGVIDRGFVQPDDLPRLMASASAFVLPSRHEPWGVAIHEAAAAGLPLICSTACGATTSLLQDGYNGFLVEAGDAGQLADRMLRMASMAPAARDAMGARSHELSRQFTPERWADTLLSALETHPQPVAGTP
ncbi:MAG: glycosyltransferase family 4 protein [Rhodothermales bacterium]